MNQSWNYNFESHSQQSGLHKNYGLGVNQSWNYNFESHSQLGLCGHLISIGVNQSWNYNFESHSQQPSILEAAIARCESVLKLQFWKPFTTLVIDRDTPWRCESVLKLQFWKPFTTFGYNSSTWRMVWISPEITILKAIHNKYVSLGTTKTGVNQSWNYNFESHSQQPKKTSANWRCESVLKLQFWKPFTTNRKRENKHRRCESVLKLQFWKPFTTLLCGSIQLTKVWISPEITILKAIHNIDSCI